MNSDQVTKHFENEAYKYDDLIPKLIPKYYEQHEVMLKLLSYGLSGNLKALDLGCGTGVLSFLILSEFTKANVVSYDLAENMLQAAKTKLLQYQGRITFQQGNFSTDDIGQDYDLIISGLAIHHLKDIEKQKLYKRIFNALKPNGIFLTRDIVIGSTVSLTEQYHNLWRQYIRSQGEDDEKWFSKYLEEDFPSSAEDQLQWLKEAGFIDVGCHWRFINFAIWGGKKPA